MSTVLLSFILGLGLSLVLTPLAEMGGLRLGAMDNPSKRRIHSRPIPRFGGPAIVCAFLLSLVLTSLFQTGVSRSLSLDRTLLFLLAGGLPVFAAGIADDLKGLGPRTKLILQIVGCSLAFYGGNRINLLPVLGPEWLGLLLGYVQTLFWFLLFINALNLIDGVDGLAGGLVFCLCLVMVFLNLIQHSFTLALLFAALGGGILGFLRFNFNPASIFLGDSGSYFLGYTVAGLAIYGSVKSQVGSILLISLVVLGIPVMDTMLAPLRRFVRGKALFKPDKRHIHHLLLSSGMTARRVAVSLYLATVALCILSIAIVHTQNELAGLLLIVFGLTGILAVQKFRQHEYLALDKIQGWALDVLDSTGLSRTRRTFLDLQLTIANSENFYLFWDRCRQAFDFLGLDHVKMELVPTVLTVQDEDGVFPICTNPFERHGSYSWTRKQFDIHTHHQQNWLLKVEVPLAKDEHLSYGTLLVVKDSKGQGLEQFTLRRIDQLRKTMAEVIGRLFTRMSSDFFGQYLVKNQVITQDQLEQALALQKEHNLSLGRLAEDRGWLTREQLEEVLLEQARTQREFGAVAESRGYLKKEQVLELLRFQDENRIYLGQALVRLGGLSAKELKRHLRYYQKSREDCHALAREQISRFPRTRFLDLGVKLTVSTLLGFGHVVKIDSVRALHASDRHNGWKVLAGQRIKGTGRAFFGLNLPLDMCLPVDMVNGWKEKDLSAGGGLRL